MVERESDRMLNRSVGRTGCACSYNLIRVGQQWAYRKPGSIGCSIALWRQIIRSWVGPQCIRRICPRTVLIYSLPHFVEGRIISTAALEVNQNVHVSTRVHRV